MNIRKTSKKRIAIIEDDDLDRALILRFLDCYQLDVEVSFFQYLNDFIVVAGAYDCVICDLKLPDDYGLSVVLRIRNVTPIPIGVLSGVGGTSPPNNIIDALMASGANLFLSKHNLNAEEFFIFLRSLIHECEVKS